MRIAQLTSLIERVPPKKYGGIERFVHYLTEELVRRGHDVSLFATADSETKAKLVSCSKKALREANVTEPDLFKILNVAKAYNNAADFDIIHNHNDYYTFPAAASSSTPTLTTLHGPITKEKKYIYDEYKNLNFVSISNAQRNRGESLNWKATIYHGIPVETFPFKKLSKDYLLVVGRITQEKGTHIAIDVATALNKDLIIAAKLDKADKEYFNRDIAPRLKNKKIHWIGEVDFNEKNKLMAEALCLLHPITWPEPFGLVMTEAMATGCPVIAFNQGSVPEVIINQKTGFIVEGEKEMIDAVKKIGSISSKVCRQHVVENFDLKRMVDGYEKVYHEMVDEKNASQTPKIS
jgi:glycosyltransferase involved in cell wall biosynthesis